MKTRAMFYLLLVMLFVFAGNSFAAEESEEPFEMDLRGTEGEENTLYGYLAGNDITTGIYNSFFGANAGTNSTTGKENSFFGYNTGYNNTTGKQNSFFGIGAGLLNTTGNRNSSFGYNAGYDNITGSGNVFIGYKAGWHETGSNKLYIANDDRTSPLIYGDFAAGYVLINGKLLGNGASAVGSAPFVLGQDVENRGIVITDKAATNPKRIYFGWNTETSMEYVEIFGLQENVAFKDLILNPNGGNVGMGTTSPSYPLQMGSGAYVSVGGTWTDASSRDYKVDIKQLTTKKAIDTLKQLDPVEFAYKADAQEKHVGFIAEDVPELVASKDRKGMSSMDVVAVLTKVVQEQQRTITKLSEKVTQLQAAR